MRHYLSALCVLLVLSMVLAPLIAHADNWRDTQVVLYGEDSYPPYCYKENGKPEGVYYRILQTATKRLEGYDVKIILLPWKRILNKAEHGEIFGFFPPYYRPKLRPFISEYSVPIYTEKTVVGCRSDILEIQRPDWPKDYYALRFGNQLGYLAGKGLLSKLDRKQLISLDEAGGIETNLRKMVDERIDCFITDYDALQWNLKRLDGGEHAETIGVGTTIGQEYGYVAYSKGFDAPYRRDFIDKLNAVILEMRASGELQAIANEVLQ